MFAFDLILGGWVSRFPDGPAIGCFFPVLSCACPPTSSFLLGFFAGCVGNNDDVGDVGDGGSASAFLFSVNDSLSIGKTVGGDCMTTVPSDVTPSTSGDEGCVVVVAVAPPAADCGVSGELESGPNGVGGA